MRHAGLALLATLLGAVPVLAQDAPVLSPAEQSRRDGGIPPFTPADVSFMQGMIGHHSQAVKMADWAIARGARADIVRLSERIKVGQSDEIDFMRNWLLTRKQPVPDPSSPHGMHMMHDGMPMDGPMTLMPGMLSDKEMADLDAAKGADFDRLFLTYMIRHHEGAVSMVEQLFGAKGAGQDDDIFKFASDVAADQTTEVDRMKLMLESVPKPKASR